MRTGRAAWIHLLSVSESIRARQNISSPRTRFIQIKGKQFGSAIQDASEDTSSITPNKKILLRKRMCEKILRNARFARAKKEAGSHYPASPPVPATTHLFRHRDAHRDGQVWSKRFRTLCISSQPKVLVVRSSRACAETREYPNLHGQTAAPGNQSFSCPVRRPRFPLLHPHPVDVWLAPENRLQ